METFGPSDLLAKLALLAPLVLIAWSSWTLAAEPGGEATSAGAAWSPGALHAPAVDATEPVIACTAEELARLRAAWQSQGPAHDELAERFDHVAPLLEQGPDVPPEPGQHNQWYQCEACQIALETIDEYHHKCPKCGEVYSGFPFDNVLYGRRHHTTFHRMEDAAWAWAVTRDERYAAFARDAMLAYAERYLRWPLVTASVGDASVDISKLPRDDWRYRSAGHIWEQTLNESMGMVELATAYDLTRDAPCISADQRRTIRDKLIRPMAENIAKNAHGKSNWQTWHNAALMWAGAALADEVMIRRALSDPQNGFVYQMQVSVSDEGMWYENSWGYHHYTLMAMTHLAEGGRRLGLDLYGHPSLGKMYTLALEYVMSDGSLPRFGDAVQDTLHSPLNEFAYAAYGDPRLRGYLPAGPTFDSILLGRAPGKVEPELPTESRVFPGAGHAILRTDGPGKLSVAMTFGPYGGFHGHLDKLSFVLFGQGQEIAVDPGRAESQAYRLPIHTEWYKATVGHNAVLVDGKNQEPSSGRLLGFDGEGDSSAVAATASSAYKDVNYRRVLKLTEHCLIIADDLHAVDDRPHSVEWVYHNRGDRVTVNLSEAEAELSDNPGFDYLRDVRSYAVGENAEGDADPELIRITFSSDRADTHLTMEARPGDKVFVATGPFRSVEDRVPVVVVKRRDQSVSFCAVIEPLPAGQQSRVKSLSYLRDIVLWQRGKTMALWKFQPSFCGIEIMPRVIVPWYSERTSEQMPGE